MGHPVGGTPKIKLNPTKVHKLMEHPVLSSACLILIRVMHLNLKERVTVARDEKQWRAENRMSRELHTMFVGSV